MKRRSFLLSLAGLVSSVSLFVAADVAQARPPIVPATWTITAWDFDPANSTGCAADFNTCTSASCAAGNVGPCATFAEIVARLGTTQPQFPLGQSVTFNQLSSQSVGVDSIFFNPFVSGGGRANLLGTLTANGAPFSPTTVTAKNRATPQLLTLNTVPVGIVAKNLIQDTTNALKGWAFVDSVVATNATMSQPVANSSITTIGVPALIEDNAWVNTDSYQAYTLPLCNLKSWQPQGGDAGSGGGNPVSVGWVQFVQIADSSGVGASEFPLVNECGTSVLSACQISPRLHTNLLGGRGFAMYVIGSDMSSAVSQFGGSSGEYYGGILRSTFAIAAGAAPTIDGDIIVHGGTTITTARVAITTMYSDSASAMNIQSNSIVQVGTSLWGTVPITVNPVSTLTGAAQLQTTGILKLVTATTGYSPPNGGTFTQNGTTEVATSGTFPANAVISISANTIGATPCLGAPYFDKAQIANTFYTKGFTALCNDVMNWQAQAAPGIPITVANIGTYGTLFDPTSGARFIN